VPGKESVVANGDQKGKTLAQLVAEYGEELLGKYVHEKFNGEFPMLVKFIDAESDLSIQVHPNNEQATERHGCMGKTEMWYVVDAKPGTYLYAGFAKSITPEEYWGNKEEYCFAYDYPGKYAVSKAAGGYKAYKQYSSELYDIKADKDEDGKSISGSRKEKVVDYLNELDADYYEKLILFKSEYKADDTYNYEIIDYLNNREDISYDEMVTILKELDFIVHSDGRVTW
jgi:mannose-6-phosphate isomerase class I